MISEVVIVTLFTLTLYYIGADTCS